MRLTDCVVAGLLSLALVTSAPAAECDPSDPTLLKPALTALTPARPRTLQRGNQRRLFFISVVANVGRGPLILRAETNGPTARAIQEVRRADGSTCTHVAGTLEFNAYRQLWHAANFAEYQLRKDDPYTGEVVAATRVSDCLLGAQRVPGFRTVPENIGTCVGPDGAQGIAAGFASVDENFYPHSSSDLFVPGRGIDLDGDPTHPLPAGNYFLVVVPNPEGLILERGSDPQASFGVASVRVPALRQRGRPPRPAASRPHHPAHTPHQ